MAKVNPNCCDQCGKMKGETNHWWIIDANIKTKSMFICPINKIDLYIDFSNDYISLTACGLECLGILESKIKEGKNPLK